ncbi:MAG: hypothetical protein HYX55_09380 [Chloroflexi bacterium]|nr:hypothetical protein [Chloroflexota bacterium]
MTDEQTPAPMPSSEPPPLAPLVQQASAPAPTPPPVAWAPAPAAAAVQGGRTGLAAAAGVIMLILGILGGLLGLFVAVVGGSIVSQLGDIVAVPGLNDPGSVIGGVVAFFGIIVVIYSLVYVIGGIGVLRSRNWGRIIGLIVGIISGLIWLSGLGAEERANLPFTIIMLGVHVYIVVVLIMFWRSKPA